MNYTDLLQYKRIRIQSVGIEIEDSDIHPRLFPFQRDVVRWACAKGRAAVFLDTGLGKTYVQLEWARILGERTLIVAPLSVARQTVRMARDLDLEVHYVRHQSEIDDRLLYITNYEMVDQFDPSQFGAVILDESSILKSFVGATRKLLIKMFQNTKYRLCCTATPAPNDNGEIGNHSEFIGVAKMNEMLAMFFVNANKIDEKAVELPDGRMAVLRKKQAGSNGQEWRLRNHGKVAFYRWLSSWAISLRKPSDLGYNDDGFTLPELNINPIWIDVDYKPDDQLFFTGLHGIADRTKVRRATRADRVSVAASLVNSNNEQWLVWCGLQEESSALAEAIPDAVEVKGSDRNEYKSEAIEAFQDGKHRVLITKAKIAGFGMNFQNAHNMVFVGLGDSWEMYYQCIRRELRYGQTRPVNVYIVLSDVEQEIYQNVMQKEAMARELQEQLITNVKSFEAEELMKHKVNGKFEYKSETVTGDGWTAMLGDSCERLKEIADESIDMSVYSPPFADLFTYSASERDLGNSRNWGEFFQHYAYIIREMLRVTKLGRVTCVHTSDIPAMGVKDGYIGMRDFPGAVIAAYEREGWIYSGCAYVQKNPQAQAIRVKAKGLAFQQLRKDSSWIRPALVDRVLIMRKPGENEVPITPVENSEIDNEKWIEWANGIWLGISESDTLQYTTAREASDEKHICPLQLGTIERCIKLYSNPGETILTPFMGIGSEAYQAIKFGRKAIGIELKESYFNIAVRNLQEVERESKMPDLFALAGIEI